MTQSKATQPSKTKSYDVDVLVVGAGPTGLAMAVQLARFGLSCRIVDKNTSISNKSKALVIHSRTMEIFEDMGVIEPALARGLRCHGSSFFVNGDRIIHLTLDDLETPYPFFLDLNQSDTEAILNDRLKSLGVEVEWSTEMIQLSQTDENVTAVIKNARGDTEEIRASYLCACDGSRSFCRHALNLDFPGSTAPQEFLLADVEVNWSHDRDEWYAYLTEEGLFFTAPLAQENRWRIITESPRPQEHSDSNADPTMEELRGVIEKTVPIDISISNPVWLSYFRVHHRILNRFREGRIFFAGDAAHIHSPIGGQGLNTGIQDAYNLAWKLALVLQKVAQPGLLHTYNAERYPIAQNLVGGTDTILRVVMLRHPVSRIIRDRVAGFLASLEVVQHRIQKRLAMLSLDYRESPISQEHRGGILQSQKPGDAISGVLRWHDFGAAPNAGDRALDASLAGEGLFTILNGQTHNLLLFAGANPTTNTYSTLSQIVETIRERYSSYIVPHVIFRESEELNSFPSLNCSLILDAEADCHHRYGARSNCLYLIRPDFYVGFRSQPAELNSLIDYCDWIFSILVS